MSDQVKAYFDSLARKPRIVSGHVVSVTHNPDTGALERANVSIGGNTLALTLDAFTPPLAVGDGVRLEQYGRDASAEYKLAGLESGARPGSGFFPVLDDGVPLGGAYYAGGDVIFGKLSGGNVFVEHATGRLYHRIGLDVYGIEYPDGSQLFGQAVLDGGDWLASGPHVSISPTGGVRIGNRNTRAFQVDMDGAMALGYEGQSEVRIDPGDGTIRFLIGGVTQSAIDAQARTIYGIERLGLPLGPAIEWGPIADPSGAARLERMGFWVRDASDRFFGVWSGNQENPQDAGLRIGFQGAEHYLQFREGLLSWAGRNASLSEDGVFTASNAVLSGSITANTGTIGGWSINATTLAAGDVILDSTGHLKLGTGNNVINLYAAGTWRLAAGHATLSSAPFRVAYDGSLYASKVHIAAGNTTINADGITLQPGLSKSNWINWESISGGTPSYIKVSNDSEYAQMWMDVFAPDHLRLDSDVIYINYDPAKLVSFFGAEGSARRAYIASPTSAQIRDIFIAFGLMAAS